MPKHRYSDCSYCGGMVKPSKAKVDFWWKDKLYLFENVPAGVCQQCGEKYFTATVAKRMEASIQKNRWEKFIEVPVSSYAKERFNSYGVRS